MGTPALRVAIVAVALLLGAVGLAKAIPVDASRYIVPPAARAASPHPSPTPSRPKTLPSHHKNLVKGVTVQIMNGSGKVGLAGDTTNTIKSAKLGYKLLIPINSSRTGVSVIYYQPGYLLAAQHLAQRYFPGLSLKQSTKYTAKLTVVLGTDFAATATSPTP